ncbi:ADAPTIN EAR-BINDING COAT-ASSOCIATED PROTEIN 1 NECAP-1 [Salix purpurea]|uniref:ADAPTIN EAR-BINDING COAT-ASSOCIATED PROTEIN 1 NECAP-1 n=1 Tax=Salix purpurea TaxID=77065 RepID=A0A9Q0WB28_SALPP|nr:ADAPTIN EAR-BINDING COAT-ASSOCIATED PROTEIN 1 NECAP-1 [Salix purpurea]
MEKVEKSPNEIESEETEAIELVLFQVSECYVYMIPPRKSAASYRADEWDVNKWAWEGTLKVISKGEECIIRLEDKTTGELYARAFLRNGSRYFVLRIEENIGGRLRHAFIGIGFRERAEAYDFQAALHDHMKYLDKKKTAEEMEQHFQTTSSKPGGSVKSKIFEQGLSNLSLEEHIDRKEPLLSIRPPPPPPAPLSPATSLQNSPSNLPPKIILEGTSTEKSPTLTKDEAEQQHLPDNESSQDIQDDDFGDFQAAG